MTTSTQAKGLTFESWSADYCRRRSLAPDQWGFTLPDVRAAWDARQPEIDEVRAERDAIRLELGAVLLDGGPRRELAEMKAKFSDALEAIAAGGPVHVHLFERNVKLASELSEVRAEVERLTRELAAVRNHAAVAFAAINQNGRDWRDAARYHLVAAGAHAVTDAQCPAEAANAELRQMVEAVRPFLRHDPHCAEACSFNPCDCGLTAALSDGGEK